MRFIGDAKDATIRKRALEGLAEAMQNRIFDAPPQWAAVSAALNEDKDPDVQKLARKLAVNFRDPAAVRRALAVATDSTKSLPERLDAVRAVGMLRPEPGITLLMNLLHEAPAELRVEAVRALAGYENPEIAAGILKGWADYPPALRAEAANTLATRKPWAKALLDAVGAKKVARTDLTDNTILRIRSFNDRGLNQQIEQVWGKFRATPKDLEALIDKMRGVLNDGPGSFTKGKLVFEQQCAKCHKFEGRGAEVGPVLDGAARDIEYLLANILDPNRVIGQPYFVHVVERKNGTNEIGLLSAEDEQTLTLKVENGVLKVIPKKEIETHTVQEKSMMPEGLAAGMSPQDFRDLVRYLMANPFLTNVKIGETQVNVGVPGRIPLPAISIEAGVEIATTVTAPAAGKYRLQVGAQGKVTVRVNGVAATLERGEAAVDLLKGVNVVAIIVRYRGENEAVYARFLDLERRLRYPE
ncbi:MAG: c-type cytochrome [Gemmataceae bacterium]